jgi:hypothetical protein
MNVSDDYNFYTNLPLLTEFDDILDGGRYHPVPASWFSVITDVVNSTGAIEAGRYKEVNAAGCIAAIAISNLRKNMDFPFLFDGDGLEYAEGLIKGIDTAAKYILPADREPTGIADFSGYTCRWQDIPSSKGETIALIVKTREGTAAPGKTAIC